MESDQHLLPFAAAEGSYAERKAMLWSALQTVSADLHLCRFCEILFERSAGGLRGGYIVSLDHLCQRAWHLSCSRSTAKRTVKLALKKGLVVSSLSSHQAGCQPTNEYRLDWSRVKVLFVAGGIGGQMYGAFHRRPSGSLKRFRGLPMRDSQAEAQADLDHYAAVRRLVEIDQSQADEP